MMEEVKEAASSLSVQGDSIAITEVSKDGDNLVFIIVSQKLSGTGTYMVDRTYDDFEWLQQHLFSQEEVPGLQGVIFPPLPAKAQVNPSAKVMKQLGVLALGDWRPYAVALQRFLRQVAAHKILNKNTAFETFLTSTDQPGQQRSKKNLFNRLSQAMEEMRKEGHKDVDDFFQSKRDHNHLLTSYTKNSAERFLDMVQTEQKIALAFAHFAASLHLCVEPGDDPEKKAFSQICVKLSAVFDSMKENMSSVADNSVFTLGLGLDLESRYQEAEKEMLFRRTCKLVELETARRNAEKAKPVKKPVMEVVKKAAEEEFNQVSQVAKKEIARFEEARLLMLQQAMVQWCEKQLETARKSAEVFKQHLEVFRAMAL
ncbi:sorting nexin-6 [Synchiropus splendidus]|uniref:sorting nexin-6 n=1 Tax=Synchiropus splendidus TaxID=270530 RepID=UPI00237E53A5|nr:sorting nexin-6 [Synchiropus splendidus]